MRVWMILFFNIFKIWHDFRFICSCLQLLLYKRAEYCEPSPIFTQTHRKRRAHTQKIANFSNILCQNWLAGDNRISRCQPLNLEMMSTECGRLCVYVWTAVIWCWKFCHRNIYDSVQLTAPHLYWIVVRVDSKVKYKEKQRHTKTENVRVCAHIWRENREFNDIRWKTNGFWLTMACLCRNKSWIWIMKCNTHL